MTEWIESGDYLWFILGVVVVEALALSVASRRVSGSLTVVDVIFQLAAGALLLLAVRSALIDEPWAALAFVTASLPAHLADLYRRWSQA